MANETNGKSLSGIIRSESERVQINRRARATWISLRALIKKSRNDEEKKRYVTSRNFKVTQVKYNGTSKNCLTVHLEVR